VAVAPEMIPRRNAATRNSSLTRPVNAQ
jgi:hypothetical protein